MRNVVERNRTELYIGKSEAMGSLVEHALRWAKTDYHVLIEGETGTGKELMARFIHEASERCEKPFVAINCGALTDSLLESELFGHEKGSFTGAHRDRKGVFEQAAGGTLFLDEIGEASETIQVKLLRVLETKEYYRIGAESSQLMTARIITATHRPLYKRVMEGAFREDLMFRLDVGHLLMPPLRNRTEDIPELVRALFRKEGLPERSLTQGAVERLERHHWPGNIRELNHVMIKTGITLPLDKNIIDAHDIVMHDRKQQNDNEEAEGATIPDILHALKDNETRRIQKRIQDVLKETNGNRKEAAKCLDVTERKLRYWLNER
ncbi:sigma 54-interacting transcriptional regulator [Alteribacter aurantiacus]|uniref:sigma 54-interacting transcriptional regulator n=1 Tax=Alteribacter aurantiacus TaxID=254410 RepID=UPI0003F6242F|nr:sigma-54 dependent transcriptional regulator [Alteribacter aurantiacus]